LLNTVAASALGATSDEGPADRIELDPGFRTIG